VLLDLDRYLLARETYELALATNPETAVYNRLDHVFVSSMSLGVGYMDECTTFSVRYIMTPKSITTNSGEKERNHTVMLSLELRTLGEATISQRIAGDSSEEGIAD
jgi:LPS-assembly protein